MADKQKWIDAQREILLKLDLASEYRKLGVDVCGKSPSAKGWIDARSFGVEDRTASAGINVADGPLLGLYKDFRGETMGLFNFAARFGGYPSWRDARNHYAHVAGVELPSGADATYLEDNFRFSELTYGTSKVFCRWKLGVTARAIKEVGGESALWPRNLSAEKTNHMITFPMYGPLLLEQKPTGYHCVAISPTSLIRLYKGKGIPEEARDKITRGEPGLMNKDGLLRIKKANVINVVEGITDLLACHEKIIDWRDVDPENRQHIVTSAGACTYHPKPEWMEHFTGKEVRLWFDVGDPKNEGQVAAAVWVKALLACGAKVRNIQLPLGPDGGKNDLRQWLNEGQRTYVDMIEYAEAFPYVDPEDSAAAITPHEAILKCLGISVVGEHEGTQKVEVFSEITRKSFAVQDVDRLTIVKLAQLCGSEVVEKYVHDGRECPPEKYDLKQIKMAIAAGAANKPFRDDEKFGAGVWECEGQILLVQSKEIALLTEEGKFEHSAVPFYNGRVLDTSTASETWCDFATLSKMLQDAHERDWCVDAFEAMNQKLHQWYWRQPVAPMVVTALCACTWLQTVWHWRPQIFVTGGSDTGKSTFLDELLAKGIFGKLSMYHEKVTEAAIRQFMRHHAKVLILDEFEKDQHRQKIFEMFRISSRGGEEIRGTADQRGIKFRLKHLPWVGAINTGLRAQADRNRFIVFDLDEIPPEKRGHIDAGTEAELNHLGMRLLAVALTHWRQVRELAMILRRVRKDGVPGRIVESFSLPCGMLSAVLGHSPDKAQAALLGILKDWDFSVQAPRDEHSLLNAIMAAEIVMDGGRRSSVSKLLARTSYDQDARESLERNGIRHVVKRDGGEIYFFCPPVVGRLLERTDFAGHKIDEYLLRIPGAGHCKQRLGGREAFWGVEVPVDRVDSLFGSNAADNAETTELEIA